MFIHKFILRRIQKNRLLYFFFFCGYLLSANIVLAKTGSMEYFVLSEDYPLKSNFEFVPKDSRLILIAQLVSNKLTEEQRKRFDEIVVLDAFTLENIIQAVKQRVQETKNARIVTNDDTIFELAARAREHLHIPGPTLNEISPFCSKYESKKRLKGSGIHYPKFLAFDGLSFKKNPDGYVNMVYRKLKFPIIIKPINLAASLGVTKVNNRRELMEWCKTYNPQAIFKAYNRDIPFIFEAFIPSNRNNLFHCDSIIYNGKILFNQVSRYTYPCMDVGADGKSFGSILVPVTDEKYKALYDLSALVIRAFERFSPIPNGVMHLEAFMDSFSGKVVFLETQLRAPGGDICSAYQNAFNINLTEMDYSIQMGLPILVKKEEKIYTAWLQLPTKTGIVEQLLLPTIKSKILSMKYRVEAGKSTTKPTCLMMRKHTALSILIANTQYDQLVKDFEYLKDFQPFKLKSDAID
jgi:hypothetical protein